MASSSSMSGPFKALADNPLDFLKKNVIQFEPAHVPPEYRSNDGASFKSGIAGVKLVRTSTAMQLQLENWRTDKEATKAFVLGFKDNKGNDDVPFVDIPRRNPECTFLFTVSLTGCSVIVTRLDENTYRVFHDRRVDSAVLYDDVEMCVNFNDYRIGGRYLSRTGKAITCMQFKGGAWKMFLQRQLPGPDTSKLNWEVYAVEKKGPLTFSSLIKEFNDRRAIIQKRVKDHARILKVPQNLIDGAHNDDEAIGRWNDLRKAIRSQINTERQRGIDRSLQDTYYRFEDDLMDSEQVDETWVSLHIKLKSRKS